MTAAEHPQSKVAAKPGRTVSMSIFVPEGSAGEVFDAICFLEGCEPKELLKGLLVARLRQAEHDPIVMDAVKARRRRRIGLRTVR